MGKFTNYGEQKALEHALGVTPYAHPAATYVELSTTAVQEDGTGSTPPVDAGGWARARLDSMCTGAAARSLTNNVGAHAWMPTVDADPVIGFSIWDASVGGNMIGYGTLTVAKPWKAGSNVMLDANQIVLSIDAGGMSDYLANKLLDHMFGVAAYTPATNFYARLDPDASGDAGYADQEIAFSPVSDDGAGGYGSDSDPISFGPVDTDFGTLTGMLVVDQLDNTLYAFAPSAWPINPTAGDYVEGTITVRLS